MGYALIQVLTLVLVVNFLIGVGDSTWLGSVRISAFVGFSFRCSIIYDTFAL